MTVTTSWAPLLEPELAHGFRAECSHTYLKLGGPVGFILGRDLLFTIGFGVDMVRLETDLSPDNQLIMLIEEVKCNLVHFKARQFILFEARQFVVLVGTFPYNTRAMLSPMVRDILNMIIHCLISSEFKRQRE